MNQTVMLQLIQLTQSPQASQKSPNGPDDGFKDLLESASLSVTTETHKPKSHGKGEQVAGTEPKIPQKNEQPDETAQQIMAAQAVTIIPPQLVLPESQLQELLAAEVEISDMQPVQAMQSGLPPQPFADAAQTRPEQKNPLPANAQERPLPETEPIIMSVRTVAERELVIPPAPINTQAEHDDHFSSMLEQASKLFSQPAVSEQKAQPPAATASELNRVKAPEQKEVFTSELAKSNTEKADLSVARAVAKAAPQSPFKKEEAPASEIIAAAIEKLPTGEIGPLERPSGSQTPTQIAPQADQIQKAVTQHLEKGNMEFQMQLNPKDLGRIDVKMVLEDGRLMVEIAAALPRTEQLLRSQMETLVASLRTVSSQELSSVQIVSRTDESQPHFEGAFHMSYQNPNSDSEQAQVQQKEIHAGDKSSPELLDIAEQIKDPAPKHLLNYAV